MENEISTYKKKGKTIQGNYLAQIDIGDETQIIIVSDKLKDRNIIFDKIKAVLKT